MHNKRARCQTVNILYFTENFGAIMHTRVLHLESLQSPSRHSS